MAKLVNLIPNGSKPKVNEALEDMEVSLPPTVERFLDRVVKTIKSYNLPAKKEQAVIAKVIDALRITPSQLSQTVQKLKKYDIVKKGAGKKETKRPFDLDTQGESIVKEGPATHIRDINFSDTELEFLMGLINNLGTGQHPWADSKTVGLFTTKYVTQLLDKNKNKIPSQYRSQQKSVESKLSK